MNDKNIVIHSTLKSSSEKQHNWSVRY